MKNKFKKVKKTKIKNIKPTIINQEPKPIDERGYPIPRSEVCFKHGGEFWLTFSFSQQNYALKHSLFYWTNREEYKQKYICSPCLRTTYSDLNQRKEFLATVEKSKKTHLRSYFSRNTL